MFGTFVPFSNESFCMWKVPQNLVLTLQMTEALWESLSSPKGIWRYRDGGTQGSDPFPSGMQLSVVFSFVLGLTWNPQSGQNGMCVEIPAIPGFRTLSRKSAELKFHKPCLRQGHCCIIDKSPGGSNRNVCQWINEKNKCSLLRYCLVMSRIIYLNVIHYVWSLNYTK